MNVPMSPTHQAPARQVIPLVQTPSQAREDEESPFCALQPRPSSGPGGCGMEGDANLSVSLLLDPPSAVLARR